MNKKIKTRKEVYKEIESLFFNPKSESVLCNRILRYLKNITGKELVDVKEIKDIIFNAIYNYDIDNNCNVRKNKSLNKLIPDLMFIEGYFKIAQDPSSALCAAANMNKYSHIHIITDVAVKSKVFKKYRENETLVPNIIRQVTKDSPAFNKFTKFILDNSDVAELLDDYVCSVKFDYFVKQIINKIIPLTSVLIFFDKNKDITQNTQDLYILLEKKFPRQTIQSVIRDNLDNIRKGKFSGSLFN